MSTRAAAQQQQHTGRDGSVQCAGDHGAVLLDNLRQVELLPPGPLLLFHRQHHLRGLMSYLLVRSEAEGVGGGGQWQ